MRKETELEVPRVGRIQELQGCPTIMDSKMWPTTAGTGLVLIRRIWLLWIVDFLMLLMHFDLVWETYVDLAKQ